MADNIGNEVAAANTALEPVQVAGVIFRQLFETGPNRLSQQQKFTAIGTITAGLIEWRKQLMRSGDVELGKWKKLAQDSKMEMEELKLKYAILLKES